MCVAFVFNYSINKWQIRKQWQMQNLLESDAVSNFFARSAGETED